MDLREDWYTERPIPDDIVIVLRGLRRYEPREEHINIMWNISHPDDVEYEEYDQYDLVCVASLSFAPFLRHIVQSPVHTLLQATDCERFHPGNARNDGDDIVFVGNSRGQLRTMVKWSSEKDIPIALYGSGWEALPEAPEVRRLNVTNATLSALYGSAAAVLNDHWDSMRDFGFLSNRLFDAVASGAFVISDVVPSIEKAFGSAASAIVQVNSADELAAAIGVRCNPAKDLRCRVEAAKEVIRRHSFDRRARDVVREVLERCGIPKMQTKDYGVTSVSVVGVSVPSCPRIKVDAIVHRDEHGSIDRSAYVRVISPVTTETLSGAVDLEIVDPGRGGSARRADVLVVQSRTLQNAHQVKQTIEHLRATGAKLVVDTDCPIHPAARDAASELYALSDANWFSSKTLLDEFSSLAGKSYLMNNSMDPRIWRDYKGQRPHIDTHGALRLLCFPDTAIESDEVATVTAAVDAIQRSRPEAIALTVLNSATPQDRAQGVTYLEPPTSLSYPRFVRWLRQQGPFHLGVAPMKQDPGTRYVSDLRLLEFAALGALPVLSDVSAYREAATSSGAVLVGSGPGDWLETLMRLLDERAAIGEQAEKAEDYVWRERSVSQVAQLQLKSIKELL